MPFLDSVLVSNLNQISEFGHWLTSVSFNFIVNTVNMNKIYLLTPKDHSYYLTFEKLVREKIGLPYSIIQAI